MYGITREVSGMTPEGTNLFPLIRAIFWGTPVPAADRTTFEEMKAHGIHVLAAPLLNQMSLPEDVCREWDRAIVTRIGQYMRYVRAQASLPVTVPYVILKGTSAAQYYPHPEYRAMGDIDIMTGHGDFQAACGALLQAGFEEKTNVLYIERARHREFEKAGLEVEVHSFYGLRNSAEEVRALDELVISHIGPSHVLPDLVNGLTLIEHVNHHMESGLGLRQVLDWMMFVDRCLPDEQWPAFQEMARKTGHERLAVVTTRMCELYLGLPEHRWCASADPAVCGELMAYILSCGNFGRKHRYEQFSSEQILSTGARSWKGTFRLLRKRGSANWEAARKHEFLRRFSWIYQAGRYLLKGIGRKDAWRKLKTEMAESRRRNALFDAIGIAREYKGTAFYVDGEYLKTDEAGRVIRNARK